mgnify:FL=1
MKVWLSTLVGSGLLATGLYFSSPHISFPQYETKKELKNTLNNSKDSAFVHEDATTTQILDFMSGVIDKNELKELLLKHGYTLDETESIELGDSDPALYRALREMHIKYANPKITFKGDYSHYGCLIRNAIMGDTTSTEDEVYPAGYNFNTNTIKLYNLDSLPFDFYKNYHNEEIKNILNTDKILLPYASPLSPQRILMNNWIAELSHAQQNQIYGPLKPQMDVAIDFFANGLDYPMCYEKKGTVEYQAHKEFEIALIEEFIALYKKYANPLDPQAAWNLAKFYGGYFKNYDNEIEHKNSLKICATKFDNPDAGFWLWNIALNKFKKLECDSPQDAEIKLDEALEWYAIAAENGSEEAIKKIVTLSLDTEGSIEKWLQWMEYLVKTSESKRDNLRLETQKLIAFNQLLMLGTIKKNIESIEQKDSIAE